MDKWLVVGLGFVLSAFVCLIPQLPHAVQPEAIIEGQPTSAWTQQLQSPDEEQRRDAARFLGQLGPAAKDAVPQLTAALKDEDRDVRVLAARALGQIGPEAKEAVPELRKSMAKCKDGVTLRETLMALRRIEVRRDPALASPQR